MRALSSIVAVLLATASPLTAYAIGDKQAHDARLRPRAVDCRNTQTGVDPSCWFELNMTNWVRHWYETHTCNPGEGFSDCFLRSQGMPAADCTVINLQSCGVDITDQVPTSEPEIFYVLYNIYAINNFFTSWWLASQFAASQAALKIDAIVELLDPIETHGMLVQDILTALLAGLAFIPGPVDIILGEGMNVLLHVAMASMMTAVVVAPGVTKGLFPPQTTNTQSIQIGQLKSQLGNLADGLSARLSPALAVAQNDLTSFTQLSSTGLFSAHPPLALDNQTRNLDQAFTVFLVTTSLMANNWNAAVGVGTNPQQLVSNGTKLAYSIGCDSYEPGDICNAWWYDRQNGDAYTLNNLSHLKDDPYKRIKTIINNGWATGNQLFTAARQCNLAGNFGKGVLLTSTNGALNMDCISQLKMCTFNKTCNGNLDDIGDGPGCEFTDCPSQDGYGCSTDDFNNEWCTVPSGYIGPLMIQGDAGVNNA